VPTQDRVRREQRPDFPQPFAAENLGLHGQPTPLVIRQQDPFASMGFPEHAIFRGQVVDDLLLLAMDQPARTTRYSCQGWRMKLMVGSSQLQDTSSISLRFLFVNRPRPMFGRTA